MLFHAVQRDEGQQDRHGLNILLILRIVAVVLVLADLQTAGAAEHHEDDAHIADQRHDPLTPVLQTANAGEHHTGPEDHFTQIVGAADDTVQSGIHKPAGIDLLGLVLLFAARSLGLLFTINDMRSDSEIFANAIARCKKSLLMSGLLFVLLFVLFLLMLFLRTGYSVDPLVGTISPVKYKYLFNMIELVWPAIVLLVGVVCLVIILKEL